MRAVLRRTRYGYLLAFHIILLCAAGRNPTDIAAFLFCSRSSVYRIVRAYRAGCLGIQIDPDGQLSVAMRMTVLMPWLMRSLGALLKATPRAYGWCRTRWSCATLAATLQAKHGIEVSAETVRRWLHEMDWVWKRAKLVAKDDDPRRSERLARIRFHHDNLQAHEVMVFADELDIPLLPKVGAAWMPQGTQDEIMTPGKNEKYYLAGALHLETGKVFYCLGPRKNNGLFRALRTASDNPSHKVSGRAPRHHCVGILGHATLPTLDADVDPMASSVCGWGKRPGASGVRRCRLLPMLLSVGRDWPREATAPAPVEPTLLGARLSSARARRS